MAHEPEEMLKNRNWGRRVSFQTQKPKNREWGKREVPIVKLCPSASVKVQEPDVPVYPKDCPSLIKKIKKIFKKDQIHSSSSIFFFSNLDPQCITYCPPARVKEIIFSLTC